MAEGNGKATLADAVGLVSKADLEAAEHALGEARKEAAALRLEVEARDLLIAEREAALATAQGALATAEQLRDEAVRAAVQAKSDTLATLREHNQLRETTERAGQLIEELTAKNRSLWDKLRAREERTNAWEGGLVIVADALGIPATQAKDPFKALELCKEAILALRTRQVGTVPVAADGTTA